MVSKGENTYYQYWGKARPEKEGGPQYHLAVYHSLDVAAIGQALLNQQPQLKNALIRLLGVEDEKQFIQWLVFFLALHDLGKFSRSFQSLRPDLLEKLQGEESGINYTVRHDSLGFLLWKKHLRQKFIEFELLKVSGSRRRAETGETVTDLWMSIVTGHHGKPPRKEGQLRDVFVDQDLRAVDIYVEALIDLFVGDNREPPPLSIPVFKRASWWLAGFTVLCDWLGSNRAWFPYCEEKKNLAEYWCDAKAQASKAIEESGLGVANPSSSLSLTQLLQFPQNQPATATPLQALCSKIPLSQSPQIVIMEDVTGAGKTEAALLLAHRMMAECGSRGIYIGLPTMATANGMYRRIAPVYQTFFDSNSNPSLVLAHGTRDMDATFRLSTLTLLQEQNYGDGTEPAAVWCNQWLADNSKKALLANMGVGTIDQLLIGILPSKYQSLRLFGLLGKVLIVDEVHACDAYMHKLLGDLLKFHAASGGSAILLSATLSAGQRQSLLNWFAEGTGATTALKIEKTGDKDYPLLTQYSMGKPNECVVATRNEVQRKVRVTSLHDTGSVVAKIERAILSGQCVCWIRNTVADAREAVEQLREKLGSRKIELFHARFCLHDRSQIENAVLDLFGPKSDSEDRRGRVVVATQVVEQSLDLDFDLLISDLAPIDLLIQRAGRLQRHTRDQQGNRIKGEDQRGEAEMIILEAEYSATPNEDWIKSMLPGTAAIYSHHGQLWLTSRWINKRGVFRMPDDARDMIESVYGEEAQNKIPQGLLDKSLDAVGIASAEASIASLNMLKLETGYPDVVANQWWDEAITPTRLGENTTIVYLAQLENGVLKPFRQTEEYPWQNSSLRIRTFWIDSEADHPDIDEKILQSCKESLPGKGKWGVLLPLVKNENKQWEGAAKDEEGRTKIYIYDNEAGLLTENDMTRRKANAAQSD